MGKIINKGTEEAKDYDVVLRYPLAFLHMFYDCAKLSGKDFCLKYNFPLKPARRICKVGIGVSGETEYPNGHVGIETRMENGVLLSDFFVFINLDGKRSEKIWSNDLDFDDEHKTVLGTSCSIADITGVEFYSYTVRFISEHEVLNSDGTVSVAESHEKAQGKELCRNKLETVRRELLEINDRLQSVKKEYNGIVEIRGNSVSDRKSRCMVEIYERVLQAELDVRFAGEWVKDMINCVEQDD